MWTIILWDLWSLGIYCWHPSWWFPAWLQVGFPSGLTLLWFWAGRCHHDAWDWEKMEGCSIFLNQEVRGYLSYEHSSQLAMSACRAFHRQIDVSHHRHSCQILRDLTYGPSKTPIYPVFSNRSLNGLYLSIHVYNHTNIHTYITLHYITVQYNQYNTIHTHIHIHIYIYPYIHIYIYTYIYTHIYIHTFIHIYTYIHTYIYIYIYIYIHAYTYLSFPSNWWFDFEDLDRLRWHDHGLGTPRVPGDRSGWFPKRPMGPHDAGPLGKTSKLISWLACKSGLGILDYPDPWEKTCRCQESLPGVEKSVSGMLWVLTDGVDGVARPRSLNLKGRCLVLEWLLCKKALEWTNLLKSPVGYKVCLPIRCVGVVISFKCGACRMVVLSGFCWDVSIPPRTSFNTSQVWMKIYSGQGPSGQQHADRSATYCSSCGHMSSRWQSEQRQPLRLLVPELDLYLCTLKRPCFCFPKVESATSPFWNKQKRSFYKKKRRCFFSCRRKRWRTSRWTRAWCAGAWRIPSPGDGCCSSSVSIWWPLVPRLRPCWSLCTRTTISLSLKLKSFKNI